MGQKQSLAGSRTILLIAAALVLLATTPLFAQEVGTVAAPPSPTFFTVMLSSGLIGLLNWAGIFLWAFLTLPLGILSIINCANLRERQYPLATKLLIIGVVWLFILGWGGVAQGTLCAFSDLGRCAPDVGVLALGISQAVYSSAGALAVCQHYLFFLLISIVIIHFKHKTMLQ